MVTHRRVVYMDKFISFGLKGKLKHRKCSVKNPAFIRHRLKLQDRGAMPLPVPLWAYSITSNTSYKLRFFVIFETLSVC